ncbi:MAG: hypothetical protein HYX84_00335 [Chloroflexi bacterium]|nr:hypothetical protein [Chloroflexota bacterium]
MLSRYLEEEGLATTQIALVRPHTEKIKPPRALWVPFELGRPLGAPNDPAFQRKVLMAALKLLERPAGPVLEDFPEDAPASAGEPALLACPYIPPTEVTEGTEAEKLCQCFKAEVASLRPWYDISLQKRQRSTVGVSKLSMKEIGDFLCSFLIQGIPPNPRTEIPFASEIRYAADDLKAYYIESVTAQPGAETTDSKALAEWFWKDTFAGKVLLGAREVCLKSPDQAIQRAALVPREFAPPAPPQEAGPPPQRPQQ